MKYDCVIWDWNGTLLDDMSASLRSVNDMLARRNMKPIDIDYYRECITTPIKGFYDAVFDMDREHYPSLLAEYNEGYCRYLADCGLAEGAREILEKLRRNGVNQVIISSCEKNQLAVHTEKYGIFGYFDAILGADDFFAVSKVDRAKNYLAEKYPEGARVLAVGDLLHDREVADATGADCILVESGHEATHRLRDSGVTTVRCFEEISAYLDD